MALDAGIVSGGGYLISTSTPAVRGRCCAPGAAVGISAVVIIETDAPGVDGWSMFFALFLELPRSNSASGSR